jgi:hypothetical protein
VHGIFFPDVTRSPQRPGIPSPSDAHDSSILVEELGLSSILLPRTRLAVLEPYSIILASSSHSFDPVAPCLTQPEPQSPLRPLLVSALETSIPYGAFGMCSEYIEELGHIYPQLVPIACKGNCAGLLLWGDGVQELNNNRVRALLMGMLTCV